jgi:NADPH2 dehydrogenase
MTATTMSTPSNDRLTSPFKLGHLNLNHRIVMAPLTRLRNTSDHIPEPFVKEYYAQRASVPGTLIFAEGTNVSPRAGGLPHMPGIWNAEQIAAWKEVVEAVHSKGSYIVLQIAALGRGANPKLLREQGFKFVSASAKPIQEGGEVPEELSEEGIKEFVEDFAQAARNGILAGFDGVEIHGANG